MTDPLHGRIVAAIGHQYQLESEIGRGGMSVVVKARDVRLNRPVAIKVLPPELAYDPAVRLRFTREAQTSAQLAHNHIVPIYDVGERDGIAYLVMAFISGGNLATLLANEPRQPIDEVRRIVSEIADALDYAHVRGVVHRDVKPDNILLDAHTGQAMVTDFGIARAMEGGTRLTVTGIAVGTPTYMSPEQAEGQREIDGRTDIYSLGVLAYQMLTGRVPFTAGSSMALLLKHVTEQPRPIAELRPETPKVLRDAIERALMKSPEDRWPTAAALRDALRDDTAPAAWRTERREPVRYTSPVPDRARGVRASRKSASPLQSAPPREAEGLALEPPHLAALTLEQRADLRLWHGRISLLDRVKTMRRYSLFTAGLWIAGLGALAGVPDVPPLILAPLVPIFLSRKWWRRGKSLRASGLRLRRVLLTPRAKWVIAAPPFATREQLEKLAPREILESPLGAAIRRAAEDRSAILSIFASLAKADRAELPDLEPTVNALVDRVASLAELLHRLDESMQPGLIQELDAQIADAERESQSPDGQRRLAMFQRQRETVADIIGRRATLARQLESAGLALGNLRLDLIKVRSSGLQSALSDVATATQQARALSRDIGVVLDAADEVRSL